MSYQGYRGAVDAAAIFSESDLDGTITYVNQKFCDISGYSAQELLGQNHRLLKSDQHPPELFEGMWSTIAAGKPWHGVLCNRKKNGELYWVDTTVVPLIDEEGGLPTRYASIRFDVTKEKQRVDSMLSKAEEEVQAAQLRLHQAEKLAALGQLSAGVAHEINNPSGFVASNIGVLDEYLQSLFSLMQAYEADPQAPSAAAVQAHIEAVKQAIDYEFIVEDAPELIRQTKDGIDRVRRIVQDLKEFSRADQSLEWTVTSLHAGIDSTLNIVNNEVKYKADVVREYGDLPDIECRPSELNQVFMNLIVNAAHSIRADRGVITVRSGVEGDQVWVEVQDNGCGIPEAHLSRIFDPFFTTKDVGVGTGLGLSVSHGTVAKHGGHIGVRSVVGEGSTFRVTLPIRQSPAE